MYRPTVQYRAIAKIIQCWLCWLIILRCFLFPEVCCSALSTVWSFAQLLQCTMSHRNVGLPPASISNCEKALAGNSFHRSLPLYKLSTWVHQSTWVLSVYCGPTVYRPSKCSWRLGYPITTAMTTSSQLHHWGLRCVCMGYQLHNGGGQVGHRASINHRPDSALQGFAPLTSLLSPLANSCQRLRLSTAINLKLKKMFDEFTCSEYSLS